MHNFFEGWYMKCQSDTQTLAVIPALHQNGEKYSCSIQVITEEDSWTSLFPIWMFERLETGKEKAMIVGDSVFSSNGMKLSLHTSDLQLEGQIEYTGLTALKYDIMGPFVFLPFMECRHSVFSMCHRVDGTVWINGKEYIFDNAAGYWEGDKGSSFPKEYLWTQCNFKEGSLMLSVAEIPIGRSCFTGIIGVVYWQGKEYRFATYLGAKVIKSEYGCIRVIQGKMELEIRLLEKRQKELKAPVQGDMVRTIHESIACRAYYRFSICGSSFFEFKTERASFEYEYFR